MLAPDQPIKKMTAVTEILTHCKKLISEGNQIDTQGLVDWIECSLLDVEKQHIMNAADWNVTELQLHDGEYYYNETFNPE